jgi:MOSC domain-containing protein YiiM
LLEDDVAIGDVLQIGEVRFEVTQARQPCSKLSAKHQLPTLVKLVENSGRTGFYLRCLVPGTISTEMPIVRIFRPELLFTVQAAYQILRDRNDLAQAEALLKVSALSDAWRTEISQRFED